MTDISAPLLVEVLEELVTALDLHRAVFIGNSVGGYAAARLAIERPDRVAGLILVNSGGFIPRTFVTRRFCTAMGTPWIARRVMPRFIRSYMKSTGPVDDAVIERATVAARTPAGVATSTALWRSFATTEADHTTRADAIAAPTLIVWGTRDTAIPTRAGRLAHTTIVNSTLHELPTGHVVFSSAPPNSSTSSYRSSLPSPIITAPMPHTRCHPAPRRAVITGAPGGRRRHRTTPGPRRLAPTARRP